MALEVRTQGIRELQPVAPRLFSTPIVPQSIDLNLMPFDFLLSFHLTSQRISQIRERDEQTGSGGAIKVYSFPIDGPQSGPEAWRIGLVQNTVGRKEICRWGTAETVITDQSGQRLLDMGRGVGSHTPFVYAPYDPAPGRPSSPPPLARVGGSSRQPPPPPPLVYAGHDLFAYPNGILSHLADPWHEQRPSQPESDTFTCTFNDIPHSEVPLYCNGQLLREFKASQAQQWCLAFSRGNQPFEPLLVTSVFTTFGHVRMIPPQRGLSHVGPRLERWWAAFVPWEESAEAFPNDDRRFPAWRRRRWREIRATQARAQRQTHIGVQIGTPQRMQQLGHPVDFVYSGQTANDWLDEQYTSHPCMDDYVRLLRRWTEQQREEQRRDQSQAANARRVRTVI